MYLRSKDIHRSVVSKNINRVMCNPNKLIQIFYEQTVKNSLQIEDTVLLPFNALKGRTMMSYFKPQIIKDGKQC